MCEGYNKVKTSPLFPFRHMVMLTDRQEGGRVVFVICVYARATKYSEYLLDLRQGVYFPIHGVGRCKTLRVCIEEDDLHASLLGSFYVGNEVVANHHSMLGPGSTLAEGVVEEGGGGFVGTGILTQDDVVEVVCHA